MTSANQGHINRLTREIADLRKREAQETRKEADAQAKLNRANEAAARTSSASTLRNKLREAERCYKALADAQRKRADISSKIADKSRQLRNYEERQAREDEKKRKKVADEQRRLIRERTEYERNIRKEMQPRENLIGTSDLNIYAQDNYDFFISHASEDKDSFVRRLAETLQAKGARVWYDEFTLRVGDSLRRQIDKGLKNSHFGVVVLSKHFFMKEWAQKELDGLSSLEASGDTRILPIWHEISKDEIIRHSPMLSDKVALNSSLISTEEIADELLELIG